MEIFPREIELLKVPPPRLPHIKKTNKLKRKENKFSVSQSYVLEVCMHQGNIGNEFYDFHLMRFTDVDFDLGLFMTLDCSCRNFRVSTLVMLSYIGVWHSSKIAYVMLGLVPQK